MKNYNKLKKVIQEANPEITELKFGCEVYCEQLWESEGVEQDEYGIVITNFLHHDNETGLLVHVKKWDANFPCGQPTKILGRPIRLTDVLMALGKLKKSTWIIDDDCMMCSFYIPAKPELRAEWNLKDNNLDNQSNECKQFLIDLLT